MREEKFNISAESVGKRLDKYLAEKLKDNLSRSEIRKLIDEGLVTIGGRSAKPHHILKIKEDVRLVAKEKEAITLLREDIRFNIVFQDEYLAVIEKPAGLTTHPPSAGVKHTLVNGLLFTFEKLSNIGGNLKPGIVHRLDKDTSGLMVIAKDNKTHADLVVKFKERAVMREYAAVVCGVVEFDEGIINAPIGRCENLRVKRNIDFASDKEAITRYRVLRRFKKKTLLSLSIETGRTHQIRVHLKHIGHPIAGDSYYGSKVDAPRQMLHAVRLGFKHPVSGEFKVFDSNIPQDIQAYLRAEEYMS